MGKTQNLDEYRDYEEGTNLGVFPIIAPQPRGGGVGGL